MNTKSTPPEWFTHDMYSKGMTLTVVKYLSGKVKKLKASLHWLELILIWSVHRDLFEKTAYFQKRILEIKNLNQDSAFLDQIKKEMIPENDNVKKFFMKFLPFKYALFLCDGFWDYKNLFYSRANLKSHRVEILKAIEIILAKEIASKQMVQEYYFMAKDIEPYKTAAIMLVGQFILQNPRQSHSFQNILNDNQVQGLCALWGQEMYIEMYEVRSLYNKTYSKSIPEMVLRVAQKDGNTVYLWGLYEILCTIVREAKEDGKEKFHKAKSDWLPVTKFLLEKIPDSIHLGTLLDLLPEFDRTDPLIVSVVEILITRVKKSANKMSSENFCLLYSYTNGEIREVLLSYLESLRDYPTTSFRKIVESYEISKEGEIIEFVLEHSTKTVKYVNDDLLFFLTWLKSYSYIDYDRTRHSIKTNNLGTIWSNTREYDYIRFVKLTEHFL